MQDDLSVRDATADDLPATASIIATHAGGTVDEWHTRFAEVLADPARLFIVAEADGAVVGFGQARFVASRDSSGGSTAPGGWYLSGVTVASGYRRRGVGRRLTEARLERLEGQVVYYAAAPENAGTIALHERLGFIPSGSVTLAGQHEALLLFRREPAMADVRARGAAGVNRMISP
ncbi:GNAT family N-acetyltransferase [Nocardioides sp. T5]|uniref:GNAT family N-acetyltransferase n=1 Tax=Nocardioides sp. T5 TaxID=3400182 RepID=UPI003A8616DC